MAPGGRLSLGGPGARPGHPPHPHPEPRPGLCAGDPPGLGVPGAATGMPGWGRGATRAGMPGRWPGGGRGPGRCWRRGTPGRGSRREGAAAGRAGGQRPLGMPRRPPPRQPLRVRSRGRATCGRGAEAGSPLRGSGEAAAGAAGAPARGRGGAGGEGPGGLRPSADGSRFSAIALAASRLLRGVPSERGIDRPAAILLRSWLNIFFPLKGGGGVSGGGVRGPPGWGSGSCGRSEGGSAFGAALRLWVTAGALLGLELGFSGARMERQPRPGFRGARV